MRTSAYIAIALISAPAHAWQDTDSAALERNGLSAADDDAEQNEDQNEDIVVRGEIDSDTRYRVTEGSSDRRSLYKDIPAAPDTYGIEPLDIIIVTRTFGYVKEPIIPYTAHLLPLIDPEYLRIAREAEAKERRYQSKSAKPG